MQILLIEMKKESVERKLKRESVVICLNCEKFVKCDRIGQFEPCHCEEFVEVEGEVWMIKRIK
jgi:hypothetical protein